MLLSKEDMFCEAQATSTTATASTNVLDFHKHGDDILHNLFWSVWVRSVSGTVDKDLTITWETCAAEAFASNVKTLATVVVAKADAVAGAFVVKNAALPKGLLRYNRLKFTETSGTKFPDVTAFVHTDRVEGQPVTGV